MDFHLEHGLRLQINPKHKNLYNWAINEIDAQGKPIGRDQVPWQWTLYFTATSCALVDRFAVESRDAPAPNEIVQSQVIHVTLRPSNSRGEGEYLRKTTYSMFGTDRAIKSFQLEIYPLADPAEQERCTSWGTVSYTTEIDFRKETIDDCIVFYMFVKPDTFARYGAKVAHGLVDEIAFRVNPRPVSIRNGALQSLQLVQKC